MAKKKFKKKGKNSNIWKKWFPIFIFIIMISPSLFYSVLNKNTKQISITMRFEIYGEKSQENLTVNENTTLISLLYKYPIDIENNTIYCIGQLCEDEGDWVFLSGSQHINPLEYVLKDKDIIILIYE